MTTFFLGGLGTTELLLILMVALIIFGAGRLPEIGEGLGKGIRSFKRAVSEEEKKSLSSAEEPKEIPPGDSEEES